MEWQKVGNEWMTIIDDDNDDIGGYLACSIMELLNDHKIYCRLTGQKEFEKFVVRFYVKETEEFENIKHIVENKITC